MRGLRKNLPAEISSGFLGYTVFFYAAVCCWADAFDPGSLFRFPAFVFQLPKKGREEGKKEERKERG